MVSYQHRNQIMYNGYTGAPGQSCDAGHMVLLFQKNGLLDRCCKGSNKNPGTIDPGFCLSM